MTTTGKQIILAMVVIIVVGFLVGTANSANAQYPGVVCMSPGGVEVPFPGSSSCPPPYYFVRYLL